ncbi:MAG: GAF domain-containing protein [Chloroflexota bacterium]
MRKNEAAQQDKPTPAQINSKEYLLAETLQEVTLALTSQIDHEAVLDEILRQAERLVPYRTAHIVLLEGNVLHAARWRGYETFGSESFISTLTQSLESLPLDTQVATSREPLIIGDTHTLPQWVISPETAWVRSHLSLPICLRDRVLGLLRLDHDTPDGFSAQDAQRLQPLSNAAAIALENARLYERERRLLNQQIAVNRLALALGEFTDIARAYQTIYEHVQALMDAEAFIVSFFDRREQLIRAEFVVGDDQVQDASILPPIPLEKEGQGPQSRVIHSGEPLLIADYGQERRRTQTTYVVRDGKPIRAQPKDRTAIQSVLYVPMKIKGETVGVMQVQSRRLNAYTQEDIELLSALANVSAIAIQNARFYAQIQQHTAELEQRVAERTAELGEQQARTQAILDAAGEGIIVTNLQGAILYMNPAASGMTGYSLAEASLDTPRLWKSGRHPAEFYQEMWQTILSGQVWTGEIVNRHRQGRLYDAAVTIAPIPDEQGQPTGFVSIQTDISQTKELDRLKDEFVSNVSHELRTPLSNIKLYLRLLQSGKQERQAHYLEVLQREAARLGQLIEDLLDVSRLDQAGAVLMEAVDLESLAAKVLTNHLPQAEANQLELALEAQPGLPPARANASQIVQVMTNLVGNAVAYTPSGGHITVQLSRKEWLGRRGLLVEVTDDGRGIAPDDLPHIFERFYRGKVGRESAPGTGLGLAICKKIVTLHEGDIGVQSAVGRGSTFTIWLPCWEASRP